MAQSRGPSVFCYNGLQIVDDGGDFDANNMWSVKKTFDNIVNQTSFKLYELTTPFNVKPKAYFNYLIIMPFNNFTFFILEYLT